MRGHNNLAPGVGLLTNGLLPKGVYTDGVLTVLAYFLDLPDLVPRGACCCLVPSTLELQPATASYSHSQTQSVTACIHSTVIQHIISPTPVPHPHHFITQSSPPGFHRRPLVPINSRPMKGKPHQTFRLFSFRQPPTSHQRPDPFIV